MHTPQERNSSSHSASSDEALLERLIVDEERENFVPQPREQRPLNYVNITWAFLLAAGKPLPYGIAASFFLGQVIELGTFLFDLKPLSDTTYDESLAYATQPYNSTNYPDTGLGKNTRDAINFADTTAENLVVRETMGTPTTVADYARIGVLSLTGLLIVSRAIWLITLHLQKKINLKYPMFKKTIIEYIASMYDDENPRGDQALEEYVADTYLLQTEAGQQSNWIEYLEPAMYALIVPMYIVLIQTIAKALNGQNDFSNGVSTEVAYQANQASTSHCGTDFPLPNNQTSSDLAMDCNYWGYANGGAAGQRTEMDAYGPFVQGLSWGLTLTALAGVVALAQRSKPQGGRKYSPVYGQLKAAANGQVWFLLLASSAFELLPLGYTIYPGKALYDGIKAQAFKYAGAALTAGGLGMIDQNGNPTESATTYAASVAQSYVAAFLKGDHYAIERVQDFYQGYFDGSPTTWGNGVAAGLLAFGAVYFAMRLAYIQWFASRSIINVESCLAKKEQYEWLADVNNAGKIDFANAHGHPIFMFNTYPNLVLGEGAHDKQFELSYQAYKWLHNFTQNQPSSRVPSLATIGMVIATGVVLMIASAQILSLKVSKQLVSLFDTYFDITHDIMVINQNCITDNQKMNCNAVAANDGLIYGTQDYMGSVDSAENKTYYLLPFAVMVGIPVAAFLLVMVVFGIENTMHFLSESCANSTSNQSDENTTVVAQGSVDAPRSDEGTPSARRSDASENATDLEGLIGNNAQSSGESHSGLTTGLFGGLFASPRSLAASQTPLTTNSSHSSSRTV